MSENFYVISTQNQYRQTLLKGLLDPGHVASTKTWQKVKHMGQNNVSSREKKDIDVYRCIRKSATEANIDRK